MKKLLFSLLLLVIIIMGYFYVTEDIEEVVIINDEIILFLEEELAWTNNENGKAFCSYELLGEENDKIYLWALCQEFYVADKQMVCSDEETKDSCFLSKTSDGCNSCQKIEVEPRIVTGGGVSVPVRLTRTEESFDLWIPRDGSLYSEDIRREFPNYLVNKVFNPKQADLSKINIEKAENYFNVKSKFNIAKTFDDYCDIDLDCGEVPGEYLLLSTCPHKMKCLNNRCSVGCYDFLDPQRFPIVK